MVWKFKLGDQEVEHFLIGTMHVGSTAAYTYAQIAKHAIDHSDVYLAEMDIDEAGAADISSAYFLPGQMTLQHYLIPRHYRRLDRILGKSFGVSLDQYQRLRPILLINQLASGIMQDGELDPLDHYLWEYAGRRGSTLGGLESVAEQKNLLLQIDLDVQIKQLKDVLRHIPYFRKVTKKTAELYSSGRYQQLYQTTARSMGALRHLLIHQRNHTMLKRLLATIADDPSTSHTIAIGAGHIGGNTGMRAGLLRAGYKVSPVNKAIS